MLLLASLPLCLRLLLYDGQGVLSKHISQLRTNTAKHTDERVRLAGEAIAGSLAVKMLGMCHPAVCSAHAMLSYQLHAVLLKIAAQQVRQVAEHALKETCKPSLDLSVLPLRC